MADIRYQNVRARITDLLFVLALCVTCFAYQPGLTGPFVFDDGVNIVRNQKLAVHDLDFQSLKEAALSVPSGPLMRPLSMVSFAINYYAFADQGPLTPYYFKLINLCIHLANGIGVYILTGMLLRHYRRKFEPALTDAHVHWITLSVATAWLLHPMALTSVLYVVQRMTSLSAFFCIWGMIAFLWGRIKMIGGGSGKLEVLASLLIFTPLAALSKENGALLPLFLLAFELSLFRLQCNDRGSRRFLLGIYFLFVVTPVSIGVLYFALHPDWLLSGYRTRDFTLIERLMTEARVIWFYIWQSIAPNNLALGLYHDDIAISKSFFDPVTTFGSIVAFGALGWAAFVLRNRAPLLVFGVCFFFVGHILESTVLPLEIAHEHRNYLPMYGVLLPLYFYLLYPLRYSGTLQARRVVSVLLMAMLGYSTFARATSWASPIALFQAEVAHHPHSSLDNGELAAQYSYVFSPDADAMESYYFQARSHFETAAKLNPNDTKALFGLLLLSENRGKIPEESWIKELDERLEYAPYAAVTSDKLVNLTKCRLAGECQLNSATLKELLAAALRNKSLAGTNRAKVLYALSSYLINEEQDYDEALDVMKQMIAADPAEPAFRLPLIRFLLALNRHEETRKELNILKRMDVSGSFTLEIENLETELSTQN